MNDQIMKRSSLPEKPGIAVNLAPSFRFTNQSYMTRKNIHSD